MAYNNTPREKDLKTVQFSIEILSNRMSITNLHIIIIIVSWRAAPQRNNELVNLILKHSELVK